MSFGSPASDYHENKLDLNRFLVPHPVATYFVKMENNRLQSEGINCGDILVIDRSLSPKEKQLIITENPDGFQVTHFQSSQQSCLFGTVTAVIRKF